MKTGKEMLKNVAGRMGGKRKKRGVLDDLQDLIVAPAEGRASDAARARVVQGRKFGQKASLNSAGNLAFSPKKFKRGKTRKNKKPLTKKGKKMC